MIRVFLVSILTLSLFSPSLLNAKIIHKSNHRYQVVQTFYDELLDQRIQLQVATNENTYSYRTMQLLFYTSKGQLLANYSVDDIIVETSSEQSYRMPKIEFNSCVNGWRVLGNLTKSYKLELSCNENSREARITSGHNQPEVLSSLYIVFDNGNQRLVVVR